MAVGAVDHNELALLSFRAIEDPDRPVAEDDLVAARTVMHGRHTGPMRNLEATGKPFAQGQSHWFRVRDGRLIEHWANRDDLGFLHQVGAAPAGRVGGAEAEQRYASVDPEVRR